MSSGCIAGKRMTCVTDLNSKQTELENNHGWRGVCCVMVILPRSCCTLSGPLCAGVPAASPDPPSAASGGPAVSGALVMSPAVPPARHAGSPPPAVTLTAASPGVPSHCETRKYKRQRRRKRVCLGQLLHSDQHHHYKNTCFSSLFLVNYCVNIVFGEVSIHFNMF